MDVVSAGPEIRAAVDSVELPMLVCRLSTFEPLEQEFQKSAEELELAGVPLPRFWRDSSE